MNAAFGEALVDEARTWAGTPWHHAGRVKRVGVDCLGLVTMSLAAIGRPVEDPTDYPMGDTFAEMRAGFARYADEVGREAMAQGCVLLFRSDGRGRPAMFNHCAIWTGEGIIHAWNGGPRRVVEHPLEDSWLRLLDSVWRWRGA